MKRGKMVIGYVETKNLPLLRDEDIRHLDVINLAFASVEDCSVIWEPPGRLKELLHAKQVNPDLKFVLSVGGWGSGGFSEAASTNAGRERFAGTAVKLVDRYGLDGLDIDWEYPCIGISGIASSGADKENFTHLIRELRTALQENCRPGLSLSIAAGGDSYYTRCTRMDEVSRYLDYVMLMTYDLRGGYSIRTGHHTNLYGNCADLSSASADRAVKLFLKAGVPREKLVIGAAFYSRLWKGVPDRNHGLMQMASAIGGYGPDYSQLAAGYIGKNGYVRYWDEEAKAPYLFNGTDFISYDDGKSIRCKAEYVKEQGLAGMMFWEYGQDKGCGLVRLMSEFLKSG